MVTSLLPYLTIALSSCPDSVGVTVHYCFKSFSCNTYGSPRKCCKQKTYDLAKPFRCNIYKKHGGGAPVMVNQESDTFGLQPSMKSLKATHLLLLR